MAISPNSWWGVGTARALEPANTEYGPRIAGQPASSVLSIDEIRTASALELVDATDDEVGLLEESAIKTIEDMCVCLLRSRVVNDYYQSFNSIMRLSARTPQDQQTTAANYVDLSVAVMEEASVGYVDIVEPINVDYSGDRAAVVFETIPSYSWARELALPVRIKYTYTPFVGVQVPTEIKQALQYASRVRANVVYRGQPFPLQTYRATIGQLCGSYSRREPLAIA